jgi:hypothetical protein
VAIWLRGLRRGEAIALPSMAAQLLCGACLYIVIAWNVAGLPQLRDIRITFRVPFVNYLVAEPIGIPNVLKPVAFALRLDQNWGMFAPYPSKEDGWYVTEGKLGDGRLVDVYAQTIGAPSWEKPALVSAMYKNQRWSKYFMNIWLAANSEYRLYFGQWLCRAWNGDEGYGRDRLYTFDITYVREDTMADGKVGDPTHVNLWSHRCYDVQVANPPINIPNRPPASNPSKASTPTPPVSDPNKAQAPIVAPDPNGSLGRHK